MLASRMSKVWKLLSQKSDDIIKQLLHNRGIKTKRDKDLFLNPRLEDFSSSLEIESLDIAKKRILKAIENKELIYINGDYDVDGICGAAVLYLGLFMTGVRVIPYLPQREKEGYGISKKCLDEAKLKGASLVISVDCGIVDFEEAQYAKQLGLDLIITDHHQKLEGKVPEAFATIHSTAMCGSAVAWCLVRKLISEKEANNLLDLVAIATIADMMPMIGINRAFVKAGLQVLNKTDRVGLVSLMNISGIKRGDIGSFEVGHMLAPRLNAAGRIADAMDSLRLLCTRNQKKAFDLASILDQVNIRRQKLTSEALEVARETVSSEVKNIHILSDSSWHPGIIGLVSGRVTEETKVPSIVIAVGNDVSKGSARSIDGINIVELIRKCADILIAVGGHPGAAGFTIKSEKIPEFKTRMEKLLEGRVSENLQTLNIDAHLDDKNISMTLASELLQFEPFGIKNHRPIFASFNAIISDVSTVGNGKHLKGKVSGKEFIGFNMGELNTIIQSGSILDIAYNLDINKFNGLEKLQLIIKDLKVS